MGRAGLMISALVVAAMVQPSGAVGVAHARGAPPVRYLPLEQVEPRRDVKASAWRSPYCVKWNDGCEACERASATKTPACSPRDPPQQAGACRPHIVECTNIDIHALNEVCALWFSYRLD